MSWITRKEALGELGVKPQTLYAYVSRGLIASKPQADDPRASLYSAADIGTLVSRSKAWSRRQYFGFERSETVCRRPVPSTWVTAGI